MKHLGPKVFVILSGCEYEGSTVRDVKFDADRALSSFKNLQGKEPTRLISLETWEARAGQPSKLIRVRLWSKKKGEYEGSTDFR